MRFMVMHKMTEAMEQDLPPDHHQGTLGVRA
jgi:hypothetical protein